MPKDKKLPTISPYRSKKVLSNMRPDGGVIKAFSHPKNKAQADSIANATTTEDYFNNMRKPEWWGKSQGVAEMSDSPIDYLILGPTEATGKLMWNIAKASSEPIAKPALAALAGLGGMSAFGSLGAPQKTRSDSLRHEADAVRGGRWGDKTQYNKLMAEKARQDSIDNSISPIYRTPQQERSFFTGGAMMDFMKNNRSEWQGANVPVIDPNELPMQRYAIGGNLFPFGGLSVQSSMPGIMNTAPAGLQPSSQVGSNRPIPESGGGISNGALAGAAGLGSMAVDSFAKPNSIGGGVASGALKGASMGAALGPWGMLAGGVIGGAAGLINAKEQKSQQQIMDEQLGRQQYAAGTAGMNPGSHIYAANGGSMYASQKPLLTQFNEGGSHESNPSGGVAQGFGSDGKPNLVEQGETKFKNYIYSDRLKINDSKSYNLGGSLDGKTFAYASKKLTKLSDERPNDPITKLGVNKSLERLKQANDDAIEMKKFSDENSQLSGNISTKSKFEYGGYIFKDI